MKSRRSFINLYFPDNGVGGTAIINCILVKINLVYHESTHNLKTLDSKQLKPT